MSIEEYRNRLHLQSFLIHLMAEDYSWVSALSSNLISPPATSSLSLISTLIMVSAMSKSKMMVYQSFFLWEVRPSKPTDRHYRYC
jgi:hypothetical protein